MLQIRDFTVGVSTFKFGNFGNLGNPKGKRAEFVPNFGPGVTKKVTKLEVAEGSLVTKSVTSRA